MLQVPVVDLSLGIGRVRDALVLRMLLDRIIALTARYKQRCRQAQKACCFVLLSCKCCARLKFRLELSSFDFDEEVFQITRRLENVTKLPVERRGMLVNPILRGGRRVNSRCRGLYAQPELAPFSAKDAKTRTQYIVVMLVLDREH